MLYERRQLLLLPQNSFRRFLESLTDKFHQLQHFNFARFQQIEDYGNCILRQDPVIAALVGCFKTAALRKSS